MSAWISPSSTPIPIMGYGMHCFVSSMNCKCFPSSSFSHLFWRRKVVPHSQRNLHTYFRLRYNICFDSPLPYPRSAGKPESKVPLIWVLGNPSFFFFFKLLTTISVVYTGCPVIFFSLKLISKEMKEFYK